jgi:transcriptional regulator with XRE-family HTH domain
MKKNARKARRGRVKLSPGAAVRVAREAQEMTQDELARASGVRQPTISGIEGGTVTLGAERAEKLAAALKVHPAVLLWPDPDALLSGPMKVTARGKKVPSAREIFAASGFIGGFPGPEDSSERYREYITEGLVRKHS